MLIEAKNRYYGFYLCPGFWKALLREHHNNRVFSIDRVRDELVKKKGKQAKDRPDRLSDWASNSVPDTFFKRTEDQAVISVFRDIVAWVNSEPQFMQAAMYWFSLTLSFDVLEFVGEGWTKGCVV